jgi:hypothetical protein
MLSASHYHTELFVFVQLGRYPRVLQLNAHEMICESSRRQCKTWEMQTIELVPNLLI